MKLNKKIILLAIGIIIISWSYNLLMFMWSKIDEPLFFRQQGDIGADGSLEISYLETGESKDSIVSIKFPEVSNEEIKWHDYTMYNENNITYRSMSIFLGDDEIKSMLGRGNSQDNEKILITKMVYTTSSGEEKLVDLGEIVIDKKFAYDKKYKILEQAGVDGSSDNSGTNYYYTKDKLKIISIEGDNLDIMNKFFDVSINEVKLEDIKLPIDIEKNRNIAINYKMKDGITSSDFEFDEYNMQIKLKCSDPEGTIDYMKTELNVNIGHVTEIMRPRYIKDLKNRRENN